jgi:hypothetical protein
VLSQAHVFRCDRVEDTSRSPAFSFKKVHFGAISRSGCVLFASVRLRAARFHRLISGVQALRSSVRVVGRVAYTEASAWHVAFVSWHDVLRRRLIYGTLVQHAAPVAIVPQPVLSHSGFSQAPEIVSDVCCSLL